MADTAPWMVGLLSVCALAAMQSTGAAYMSTAGGMLTRDLIRHFLMPNIDHRMQKLFGRIGVGVIVLLALIVATTSTDALVLLGGLAVAYGFQMWPALIAVCYWPWLTRQGVVLGLIAGLIAVTLTDMPSVDLRHRGLGPLAVDHPLRRLGHHLQPRRRADRLGDHPGRHGPQDGVPQLPGPACRRCRRSSAS